jgi:hypothetical protein
MRRAVATAGLVAFALAASVAVLTTANGSSDQGASAESTGMPIVVRCPRASDQVGQSYVTADQVIAVARSVNHREVTHYQGRAVRRTRWNTPVQGLVMYVGEDSLYVAGRRVLAARAKKRCGKLGLASSAVTFHDSLSTICCQTFTLFVARGRKAWIVFWA